MYVSVGMYQLETEVTAPSPPHLRVVSVVASYLQGPQLEPHQTASTSAHKQRASTWVFSLEAQGLLLVPTPWSRVTGPSLSLSVDRSSFQNVYRGCPKAILVLRLLCCHFSSLLLLHKIILECVRCSCMLSVRCVHGEKIHKRLKRQKKKQHMELFIVCKSCAGIGDWWFKTHLRFLNMRLNEVVLVKMCVCIRPPRRLTNK